MKNIFHWFSFVIKLIIILLLFPFFLIWLTAKYLVCKTILVRNLALKGLPVKYARELSKGLNPFRIFSDKGNRI